MKVTLADLAAHAGVSQATVSRVLNDRPSVAESTRQAVLTALEELDYQRQTRNRPRDAGLVGLLVPELSNPIFPQFAQAIEGALARRGFTPVLCAQMPGGVQEDEYVQTLLDRGVAGIVFVNGIHAVAGTPTGRYTALRTRGVPIVLINGYLSDVDAPFVSTDDTASVDLAVDHLVSLGHQRIGLVSGPARYLSVQRRVAAFHAAMRRQPGAVGTDAESMIASALFRVEGGQEAAAALLDRGATGLICNSDLMALGAIREAAGRGLQVPADVSVVGSDDSPLMEFTAPPLTTVRQAVSQMSAAAVHALLDEIAGVPAPRAEFVFRPELVVRASTAAPPRPRRTGRAAPRSLDPSPPSLPRHEDDL